MPKNGRSGGSNLLINMIICSDNGASCAIDLSGHVVKEPNQFIFKDCGEVYDDSCPICRRKQK